MLTDKVIQKVYSWKRMKFTTKPNVCKNSTSLTLNMSPHYLGNGTRPTSFEITNDTDLKTYYKEQKDETFHVIQLYRY